MSAFAQTSYELAKHHLGETSSVCLMDPTVILANELYPQLDSVPTDYSQSMRRVIDPTYPIGDDGLCVGRTAG